ncbi:MAG: glycosyltransferase family 4 protein [Bryobacterales bacterium]|nr:glycosyltransferase family 4 protein [Bryobacterales bacterium]
MSTRPRALYLTPESPYPTYGGGALRSASILEYLLPRYETDVYCFVQNDEAGNPPAGSTIRPEGVAHWTDEPLPYHRKAALERAMRNTSRVLRRVPPLVDRFSGFDDHLRAAIGRRRYDVAVIEHFWCAPYIEVLRPVTRRVVLDLHNIESVWHQRAAAESNPAVAAVHRQFAKAAADLERRLLPQFDLLLVTSDPDRAFVEKNFSCGPVAVVKNTIPMRSQPEVSREDEIVFSGYMDYIPNQTAVLEFARDIWPAILDQRPSTLFKVVGKSARQLETRMRKTPQIRFVSDPEDAIMEIASASVAVVPLRVGSGTRLKIVEAWAAGTPVVSTTLGAEGLECEPDRDLVVADRPEDFASKVVELLEHPRLAHKIAAEGRRRYEAAYTWQTAWRELAACEL